MNNGSVQGLSLCLLNAYASPVGFSGAVIAPTLALALGISISVSKIGFASSRGLPEISLNFVAHDSASVDVGRIFVLQLSYFAWTKNIGVLPIGLLITTSCIFSS